MTAWKREGSLVPLGIEIALAFALALSSFVIVAVTFDALEATALVIAAIVVYGAAIFWIAQMWGVAYGVPVAMAAVLAYDWFQVPPTHELEIPDTANLEELLVFFALSVLVGESAAYASQRAHVSEEARDKLLDEQAALRRVATLVAQEAPPSEVFSAVAEEVIRLLDVDDAALIRYDDRRGATSSRPRAPPTSSFPSARGSRSTATTSPRACSAPDRRRGSTAIGMSRAASATAHGRSASAAPSGARSRSTAGCGA